MVKFCCCCLARFEYDIAVDRQTLKLAVSSNHDKHGRDRRAAIAYADRLWPHGVVPYEFDSKSAYSCKFGFYIMA